MGCEIRRSLDGKVALLEKAGGGKRVAAIRIKCMASSKTEFRFILKLSDDNVLTAGTQHYLHPSDILLPARPSAIGPM